MPTMEDHAAVYLVRENNQAMPLSEFDNILQMFSVHLLSNALYEAQHTSSQTLLYCARRWCYASILVVGGALITSVSMGIQVIASGIMITAFRSRHLCYKQRIREPGNTCHLQRRTQHRILIRC